MYSETREIYWSGGPSLIHEATAGKWGCDPCDWCGRRPPEGARVWLNSYNDLICDDCATRLAVPD